MLIRCIAADALVKTERKVVEKERGAWKPTHITLMLHLDETFIFGNGRNDVALSLQWIKSPLLVRDLYKLFVSPCGMPRRARCRVPT